jgi:phage terminase large subunit-like protein
MVRRLNFCQWLQNERRWFTPELWAANGADPGSCVQRPAILGVDLSNTDDLSSLVLICPSRDYFADVLQDEHGNVMIHEVAGHVDVLCWAWCPESKVREQTKRGFPYDMWVRQGALIPTPGNTIDRIGIRRFVSELRDKGYWIVEIAYDRAYAEEFAQEMQDQHGFIVTPIEQHPKNLNEPSMLLERLVKDGKLRHGNTPVMRWAAGNVMIDRDNEGRIKPSKKLSQPHGKIDPISALVTGLKRLHVLQGMGTARNEAIIGPPRASANMYS